MLAKAYKTKGLKLTSLFSILGITLHNYYYNSKGTPKGKQASEVTLYRKNKTKERIEVANEEAQSEEGVRMLVHVEGLRLRIWK